MLIEHNKFMVVAAERKEGLFDDHTRTCRIVADLMPSKADRQEFIDEVAKLETSSETMRAHIGTMKRAQTK